MRRILCREHGQVKPTPAEDIARGLHCRYVRGILTLGVVCDQCGVELPRGSAAVAFTQPSDRIGRWEDEYMLTNGRPVRTPRGVFVIDDEGVFGITIEYTKVAETVLAVAIEQAQRSHAEAIAGLDLVCEERQAIGFDKVAIRLYYAHPGTYTFIEYEAPIRPHEFKGTGAICEECGLWPGEEVHV